MLYAFCFCTEQEPAPLVSAVVSVHRDCDCVAAKRARAKAAQQQALTFMCALLLLQVASRGLRCVMQAPRSEMQQLALRCAAFAACWHQTTMKPLHKCWHA
jgi:hypothetical protein